MSMYDRLSPQELDRPTIDRLIASNEYTLPLQITYHKALFALVMIIIALIRISNLNYNTLFVDEAIYVNVGYEIRHGIYTGNALSWMFGSYIYPIYVSIADQLGGELGVRVSSVVLNLITSLLIFLTTRRLFDFKSALWAMLLFGLASISINLARQAVYDSMGVTLAALAVYLMIIALQTQQPHATFFAIASGVTFALCFLVKYIGVLMLPALGMIGLVGTLAKTQSIWSLLRARVLYAFVLSFALIAGTYLLFSFDEVRQVFSGVHSTDLVFRGEIIKSILTDLGLISLFSLIGFDAMTLAAVRHFGLTKWRPEARFLIRLLMMSLFVMILVMQVYHVYTENFRSLWKHNVYTLILLGPLAGYGITRVLAFIQTQSPIKGRRELNLLLGSLLFVMLMAFISSSLDYMWGFQYSWPNIQEEVEYLKAQSMVDLTDDLMVLSSVSTVYEYYLGIDYASPNPWFSNWFFEYKGLPLQEGINAAVEDCALDLVILDDYYTTDINATIEPALIKAGYIQIYSELQQLNSGDQIGTRMYTPAIHNQCAWRASTP